MSDNFAIPAGERSSGLSSGEYQPAGTIAGRTFSAAGSALVTAVVLPFALLTTTGRRMLLAVVILNLPLQLCTHLYWDQDSAKIGALGGVEISASLIALVLLYVAWIVGYASRRELGDRITFRTSLPLFLYLLFYAISIFAAEDQKLFGFEFFVMVQVVLLYVYLINWVRTRRDVMFVVYLLLAGMILESLVMVAVRVGGPQVLPAIFKARMDDTDVTGSVARVGGTIGSPNAAGTYFAMLLAPVFSLLLMRSGAWYKLLAGLTFGLGGLSLLITFTRGSWLACGLSLSVLVVCGWRILRPSHKALYLVALIVFPSAILIQKAVSDRLLDSKAAFSRVPLTEMALRMIADHPIIGVGGNNYILAMPQYATKDLSGEWLYAVHNKYLLVWAETGPGALIAFVWFIVAALKRGWKVWKRGDPSFSPLGLGLMSGLVAFSLSLMFEPGRGSLTMELLLVFASLLTAMQGWTTRLDFHRTSTAVGH